MPKAAAERRHGHLWLNTRVNSLHVGDAIIVVNKPAGLPVLPDGYRAMDHREAIKVMIKP